MTDPHVQILAHHYLLLALPAFVPAVIVVGVILYIAVRDRRERGADSPQPEASGQQTEPSGQTPD